MRKGVLLRMRRSKLLLEPNSPGAGSMSTMPVSTIEAEANCRAGQPPAPTAAEMSPAVSLHALRTHCNNCSMRELCLPVGLEPQAMQQLDELVTTRVQLQRGGTLYRAGDRFSMLYAIRTGFCKTTLLEQAGHEQVMGYHMLGDIIGMDGIGTGSHGCQAIALEDTELCTLPFSLLEDLARNIASLQHNLHQVLAREITRDQNIMLMLGRMRAEERLALFLLNLSDRYEQRGYSSTEFVLRMTRMDIGSYLGLKLETVSRLFSRLQSKGLIRVQGRTVTMLDRPALEQLVVNHPS